MKYILIAMIGLFMTLGCCSQDKVFVDNNRFSFSAKEFEGMLNQAVFGDRIIEKVEIEMIDITDKSEEIAILAEELSLLRKEIKRVERSLRWGD